MSATVILRVLPIKQQDHEHCKTADAEQGGLHSANQGRDSLQLGKCLRREEIIEIPSYWQCPHLPGTKAAGFS